MFSPVLNQTTYDSVLWTVVKLEIHEGSCTQVFRVLNFLFQVDNSRRNRKPITEKSIRKVLEGVRQVIYQNFLRPIITKLKLRVLNALITALAMRSVTYVRLQPISARLSSLRYQFNRKQHLSHVRAEDEWCHHQPPEDWLLLYLSRIDWLARKRAFLSDFPHDWYEITRNLSVILSFPMRI